MTAETITREEIERLLKRAQDISFSQVFSPMAMLRLIPVLRHALDEPARLTAARAEGMREGLEMAARWCRTQAYCASNRERAATDEAARRAALLVKQTLDHAADCFLEIAPAPAEAPTAPTVAASALQRMKMDLDAIRDASVAWKEDHATMENLRARFAWLGEHDEGTGQTEFKVIEARIAALEAENAKLRERNSGLEEGLRPFAVECAEWVDQIHLLPNETVPEIKAPSDDAVAAARFTLGDLRRARALLQGGPDAG